MKYEISIQLEIICGEENAKKTKDVNSEALTRPQRRGYGVLREANTRELNNTLDTKESARRLCVSRLQEGVRSAFHASKQLLEERMKVREAIEHVGCHSAAAYNTNP